MKQLPAALIGGAVGSAFFVIADIIFQPARASLTITISSSATASPVASTPAAAQPGQQFSFYALALLPPIIGGLIAGLLAARGPQQARRGGRAGAIAALLAALILIIVQTAVEIYNINFVTSLQQRTGQLASPVMPPILRLIGFLGTATMELAIIALIIELICFIACDLVLAPSVGALIGFMIGQRHTTA
jgi:hypothetical protein